MMTFARLSWVCIEDPCPTIQCLVHVLFHSCEWHSFWWVFINIETMFCSEEYPLFLPRQGGHGTSVDGNSEFSKSVGSNFGLSSMENLRSDHLGSRGTLVNYRGASSSPWDTHPGVQRGIKILQRSVGCICTYGFGLLSLPVPLDLSTFDACTELLLYLSSKEARIRFVNLTFSLHVLPPCHTHV
jgi:hypothetical protein